MRSAVSNGAGPGGCRAWALCDDCIVERSLAQLVNSTGGGIRVAADELREAAIGGEAVVNPDLPRRPIVRTLRARSQPSAAATGQRFTG